MIQIKGCKPARPWCRFSDREACLDISFLLDRLDVSLVAALFGLITGAVFGVAAQRSPFCLRAATVEFARGGLGTRVSVWFLPVSTAVMWQLLGLFRAEEARVMAITGT